MFSNYAETSMVLNSNIDYVEKMPVSHQDISGDIYRNIDASYRVKTVDFKRIREGVHTYISEPEISAETLNRASDMMMPQLQLNMEQRVGCTVDELAADEMFKLIVERLNRVPMIKQECRNCGGVLELSADKHIFHCPYCNSVYAVGVSQINSR